MKPKISVIIPAYNEEQYIEKTAAAVMDWPVVPEVIIIDDGSTDQTAVILEKMAKRYPLKTVCLTKNRGKGNALMKGVQQAKGEILVFLDADLMNTARHAYSLLDPIVAGTADMTIALFPPAKKKGGFGLVKHLAKTGIRLLTGVEVTASLSGQRALKREVIEAIPKLISGFGIEVGLTIDAIRKGYQVQEVEIPLTHRETGRNLKGFLHRGKEFFDVSRALIAKWREWQ